MVLSFLYFRELQVFECLNDGGGQEGVSFNSANFRKWELTDTKEIQVIEFTKVPLA